MKESLIKGAVASVSAFVLSIWGEVAPWVWIILIAMILDYGTGMTAAWRAGNLNSKIGIDGIFKKVGYLVVIAVAMIADLIILNGSGQLGFTMQLKGFVSMMAILWLLINELISILENVGRLGALYPAWLMKLLSHLKQQADKQGEGITNG